MPDTFAINQVGNMFRNGQLVPRSKHRTNVWKYFVYSERKDKTTCAVDLCKTVLSGKNTTRLRRHLQLKHPVIYAMLPRDGIRSSGRGTSDDQPSPQVPGIVTDTLRKKFKKKLKSIMDSLLKSTVSEVANAFDVFTFDHQMVVKQKIEECSMLRLKLEKAEKKLREQNGMWGQMEDVTHTSGQMMPELTVDVPDDWCAPLGCENVVDQTPSTSYEAREDRSSSLCSLSVSLWRLPDIKQEVQDDGYQLDSPLSCPYSDEGPQHNLEPTKDQKKPLSTTKHSRPRSVKATGNLNRSIKPKPEQPLYAAMRSNESLPRTEKVKMQVPNTEKGRGKKRNLRAIKLEPEPMEDKSVYKTYRCKFCSKLFDTEFGRSVHLRSHKTCTGCHKIFQFPSHLRNHKKTCANLQRANCLEIEQSLRLRKRKKLSPGEDTSILPIETQHANRKLRAKKRSKNSANLQKRDKAFLCTNCHKSFCSIVWLKNHTSKHLPCPKCYKIFCTKYFLQRHIYKDHPQNPNERLEPSKAVDRELAAISSMEKLGNFSAVSSKEKHSELGAGSSKENPKLGAVSSKENPKLGAVSSKEKRELGAVSSKEKLSKFSAVSSKEKLSKFSAVSSKEKLSKFSAVSSKEKSRELGAVSSNVKQSAFSAKENFSELGAVSSKEKHRELGAVSSKEKLGAVSPKEKQCCEDDSKNVFG
ncbi:unnamed protein product [Lota lota]